MIKRQTMAAALLAATLLPFSGQAQQENIEYVHGSPEMHVRVMSLSAELRCLVCQGQSLADSHSDFAIDMRNQMQEMMEAGKSDREVVNFLVERYGETIRYRPALNATTAILWFSPVLLLAVGIGVLYFNVLRRKRRIKDQQPLSAEDQQRAEALLQKDAGEKQA